ncbi:hypothetical protein COX73_02595 [bacterium (Candidatus Gribaldobacteria) CG_4_10_14_0_2_um_filter_36_18]|uniref:Uncharacterized protein n=1 Tax=bacterium (Candidatus Gribaldobacteria) CG_4_10_14_0_2_um_filter_36_18 TaxID=2014264 RepID=A0A2M7VJR7_9BACT|nr:MAG: hypothetical protein COX73_02595 [bacterium (Candidatus Gribaldobacteria) CG_4_10_14_0_2_um_filter_36_18]
MPQTTAKYQVDQKLLQNITYPTPPLIEEEYNLFILGGEVLELGKIFHFETPQPKKKLKGLFKGLKIEEEEIEEAKKSLFPEREF